MDFYIIHGLILCFLPTPKKDQNLLGILVSSLQLNTFIVVELDIFNTLNILALF